MSHGRIWVVGLLFLLWSSTLFAEATRFYVYEGFNNFLDGDAKGTALTDDGQIALASPVDPLFQEKGHVVATAVDEDRIALALAETRHILVIDKKGTKIDYGVVPQGIPNAIAITRQALYIATLGPTKIYKLTAPNHFETLANPRSSRIKQDVVAVWSFLQHEQDLYAATEGPGSVFRFRRGMWQEIFSSREAVLRSLAKDSYGRIYAGGGSKGIVYRGDEKGNFTAIYDSGLEEITGIVPAANGDIFFSGLANAQARDAQGERIAEKGKIRAQLLRLDAQGFAELVAGSDDEILYTVSDLGNGEVLAGTGSVDKENPRGRIYLAKVKTREISLFHQTLAAQVISLLPLKNHELAIVTNDPVSVQILHHNFNREGRFTPPVFDAQVQAQFGAVQLDVDLPHGTSIGVRLRSGQTSTPDSTWNAWSQEYTAGVSHPGLTRGRFVQAEIILRGNGQVTPKARRLRIAYKRQNIAPFIGEISLLAKDVVLSSVAPEIVHEHTFSLNDKGFSDLKRIGDPLPTDPAVKVKQTTAHGVITVVWSAQDPNGDVLQYDFYMRREGEKDFHLVEDNLEVPFYTFAIGSLADGYYQFRVVAKDNVDNAPEEAKQESKNSTWFLVDNAPPQLSSLRIAEQTRLQFSVKDAASIIVKAEYAVDGGRPRPLIPKDGLLDSREEYFDTRIPELIKTPAHHIVSVRVEDEAQNAAQTQILVP